MVDVAFSDGRSIPEGDDDDDRSWAAPSPERGDGSVFSGSRDGVLEEPGFEEGDVDIMPRNDSEYGEGDEKAERNLPLDSNRQEGGQGGGEKIPFLWELTGHVQRDKRIGGGKGVCVNQSARDSEFYPFPNLETLLLFLFAHTYKSSRQALADLFFILRFTFTSETEAVGSGGARENCERVHGFERDEVPRDTEYFLRNTRVFLPLLEVFEDTVPSTVGGGAASKVFLFPLSSILYRILRSPKAMQRLEKNAAGHILRGEKAAENGVAEDHCFPVPTRRLGDRQENNVNADIARGCGLYTGDGVQGTDSGENMFPGDVAVCFGLGDETCRSTICRVLELFFDAHENGVRLTL